MPVMYENNCAPAAPVGPGTPLGPGGPIAPDEPRPPRFTNTQLVQLAKLIGLVVGGAGVFVITAWI